MDQYGISLCQDILFWLIHQETRRFSPGTRKSSPGPFTRRPGDYLLGGAKNSPRENFLVPDDHLLVLSPRDQEIFSWYQEKISRCIFCPPHQEIISWVLVNATGDDLLVPGDSLLVIFVCSPPTPPRRKSPDLLVN